MKVCVGVFFGGKSTEHEISCISASQAMAAIDREKYDVLPIYISKTNEFYIGDSLFDIGNFADIVSDPGRSLQKVAIYKDGNRVAVAPVKKSLFVKNQYIDVAFPVVHGTNVEDGSLAGFLEMLDIPYTSCDVLGGSIGQDKAVMKDIFKANDIRMVPYLVVYGTDFKQQKEDYKTKAGQIGYPLIAKPANLGSSVGIEVISCEEEFEEKVLECLKYDFKIVVEKMIQDLKEVNISVLGSREGIRLSQIEEVTNGFLDFEKKYEPGKGSKGSKKLPSKSSSSKGMASLSRKVPALLKEGQEEEIRQIAEKAFRVLNSHGCVRIDFMIDQTDDIVYINEINTIPGSLSFYLWEADGLNFTEECDILIKNALRRYALKEKKIYSFDTNILNNYRRN